MMLTSSVSRRDFAWQGFTLVEFMIVLAVLGILSVLALPMMQDIVLTAQVRSAAMDIYAGMAFARSEAIKRNSDVTITPTGGDWKNGWTITAAGVPDALRVHDSLPSRLNQLPGEAVTYTRDGRLASGAEFVLNVATNENSSVSMRCVTARASGQPHIRIDANHDGNCNNG